MQTKAQVYQTLYDWLKGEVGTMTVIKANQKGPRPERPYASINFLNPSSRLGDSIDQQSITTTPYPAAGFWWVTLNTIAFGDSLTIEALTFTPVDSSVKAKIDRIVTFFSAYSYLNITRISDSTFDVYRNTGGPLAIPTFVGDWTVVASPLQGTNLFTVATEGMRKAVASINIFGDNAIDTLSQVRDSLDRPDVVEAFERAGISHLEESPVNDLTALQETIYEERGQMDLTVGYVAGSEVDVGTIEHVEIEGTADGHPVAVTVT